MGCADHFPTTPGKVSNFVDKWKRNFKMNATSHLQKKKSSNFAKNHNMWFSDHFFQRTVSIIYAMLP